ncbi:MAG: BglG family transcription antiterminator [Lactovum sp.]
MEDKFLDLLNNIYTDRYVTAKDLASLLKVSEKTVRNRISDLNDLLKNYDSEIISRHGKGYKLKKNDFNKYEKIFLENEKDSYQLPTTPVERISYILVYLLEKEKYVKIEDICDFLYVSRNTVINDMKTVKYILKSNYLILDRKPNYGIKVIGEEVNKRICLANNVIKYNQSLKKSPKQIKEMSVIAQVIISVFEKHQIKISETSLDRLVIHIYINSMRFKKDHFIGHIRNDEIINQEIFSIVKELTEDLEIPLNIKYNEDEIYYLAIHLASKISSDNRLLKNSNFTISEIISDLIDQMLEHIYTVFDIDFRDNFNLKINLSQHMVPLDIRMNYSIPLKNEMLEVIKTEFSYAYTIATEACVILNQYYGHQLIEDEVAFFALIFALALEKREKEIQKKNIVLIYISGKASVELFKYKYRKAFGRYIENIYECTVADLTNFDFKKKNIDYVFTTISINMELTVPVFEIDLFPNGDEIMHYREMFERGNLEFLKNYYKKELFFSNLELESKEEIIKYMSQEAQKYFKLPEDFTNSIFKREELGFTDFTDKIAMPHTHQAIEAEDNFVSVFISSRPVFWGKYEVQVIFMIVMTEEKDDNIDRFYELTTEFLFNKEKVESLIEEPNYEHLIKLLLT